MSIISRAALAALFIAGVLAGCSEYDGPAEVARARAAGVAATAKILRGEDTRSRKNELAYVRFALEIQPDDGTPKFTAEAQTLVNLFDLARYQPGTTARIRFLRDNPRFFAFTP